ncbi:MAG: terminase large subunit [Flavobacteriaceae bacterium]
MTNHWNFACPDWAERLAAGQSLVPDLPLDQAEADRAVAIFNRLCLPDVPGQPSMEEAAGDWIRDIVRALFGSLDDAGRRRVSEIFALVPKKSSKTTNGAGIMVTALLLNRRPRAEFLLVAPTQDIADLAFQQASGMIECDPEGYLQKRFSIHEHIKTIRDRRNKATLKIKTFDMKVMTGAKPSGVLVDEVHVMQGISYASRVIGQIRGGLLPNPEAFLIFITTQSDQPPAGVFKAELEMARGVRDGRIEKARVLPVLYEFTEEMQRSGDWEDPALWPQVLPNLGRSIELDRLVDDHNTAKSKGDEELRRWASQHLNVQIGLALHADRWEGADHWEAAADKTLTLDELMARSEVCTVGIDGGGLDDLLGLSVIGREKTTRRWLSWGRAWAHESVLVRRKNIAERLQDFARDEDLTICSALGDDVAEVAAIVHRLHLAGLLPKKMGIGLDPVGVAAILDELALLGIDDDCMVGVPQGYKLSGVIKGAARKLADGSLSHADQAMMDWCVSNAKAEQRGNALLVTKQAAGSAKIDPLIAFFNAFDLMSRSPEASGPSVYRKRGALVL